MAVKVTAAQPHPREELLTQAGKPLLFGGVLRHLALYGGNSLYMATSQTKWRWSPFRE